MCERKKNSLHCARRFKIALSKGAEETAEALLVVHVLLKNGLMFVYDGTDGNKGAGHQLKVKANRLFSCRVDALADSFKVSCRPF